MFNTVNIEAALKFYYGRLELSSDDIRRIFGPMSSTTIARMKKRAREQMVLDKTEHNIWNARNVNTVSAFKAWGLDPEELERRLTKLRQLNLVENCNDEK